MSAPLKPVPQELLDYRKQIDALDVELIDAFARRFDIVRQVGLFKAQAGIEVVQSDRAKKVIDRAAQLALEKGVDPDFARSVYEMMIDIAHDMEHEIVEAKGKA